MRAASPGLAGKGARQLGPDDDAGPVLHEKERSAQHRGVLAEMKRSRRERILAPEPRQHPVLAGHVVGARRQRSRRRPSQHAGRAVHLEQVVEIGESGRELTRSGVR